MNFFKYLERNIEHLREIMEKKNLTGIRGHIKKLEKQVDYDEQRVYISRDGIVIPRIADLPESIQLYYDSATSQEFMKRRKKYLNKKELTKKKKTHSPLIEELPQELIILSSECADEAYVQRVEQGPSFDLERYVSDFAKTNKVPEDKLEVFLIDATEQYKTELTFRGLVKLALGHTERPLKIKSRLLSDLNASLTSMEGIMKKLVKREIEGMGSNY